ncbi:MAG: hypothetical protein PHX78_00445 [bacterium]|nr:hypothetical protein [bacterium]
MKYKAVDLKKVKTYSIKERKNLVSDSNFAKPFVNNGSFNSFYNSLPDIHAGHNFREVIKSFVKAFKQKKTIVFLLGGHVIKCGLSPLIIDLMKNGIISGVALNGAGSIHDFEIAFGGGTSEDVSENLKNGSFGMVEETGYLMNTAINNGYKNNSGIGYSLGSEIEKIKLPNRKNSILYWGKRLDIPVTVHVAIGTDIIHQHPEADGKAIGQGSFLDFKLFCGIVSNMENGVVCNFGSAVILPEVFLKALTIARNLNNKVENFTAVNFDQIQHYRPNKNIIERPTMNGGKGYSFTGHHEFMLPLLAASIKSELKKAKK